MTEDIINLVDTEPPERYRFDYKGMHRYLVALPAFGAKKVFTERSLVEKVLNALRDSALHHQFDVYAYCFLPDQVALIVRGKEETSMMKEFLADFRSRSSSATEEVLGHPLWRKKYLERVLRKTEDSKRIAETIFQMPVKAGLVVKSADYEFQGSFVIIPGPKKWTQAHSKPKEYGGDAHKKRRPF